MGVAGDEGWTALEVELGSALPEVPGATAIVTQVVTTGRREQVVWTTTLVDGRVAAASPGADETADLVFTRSLADARAAWRGEVGDDVAFMQGRIKVVGPTHALFALLPVLGSAEYRTFQRELVDRAGVAVS